MPRANNRLQSVMDNAGRAYLEELLIEHKFDVTKTARAAEMNRQHMYKVFKRLGIELPQTKELRPSAQRLGNWEAHAL